MKLSARALRFILNCYPPFLGAGIKVETINSDFSFARVSMRFRWYNKNYMRTQFGGSLYSMTDPFFALMLIQRLGPEFVVWDKHGEINYIKPGESRVYADFVLKDEQVEHIKTTTVEKGKFLPVFHTEIYDEKKQTIATVKKCFMSNEKKKNEVNRKVSRETMNLSSHASSDTVFKASKVFAKGYSF